jgi:hypothetical protein
MWTTLLIIHIMSGSLALLAGPVAMMLPKRRGWHTKLGTGYVVLVGLLSASAVGLAAMKPALWWLGVIAGATLAAVLAGRELRRRHPPGWLPLHISMMCGSYISVTTALLVVNLGLGSVLAWALPTVAGTPLIARRAYRAAVNPGKTYTRADTEADPSASERSYVAAKRTTFGLPEQHRPGGHN